jgi:hypothetical protein
LPIVISNLDITMILAAQNPGDDEQDLTIFEVGKRIAESE